MHRPDGTSAHPMSVALHRSPATARHTVCHPIRARRTALARGPQGPWLASSVRVQGLASARIAKWWGGKARRAGGQGGRMVVRYQEGGDRRPSGAAARHSLSGGVVVAPSVGRRTRHPSAHGPPENRSQVCVWRRAGWGGREAPVDELASGEAFARRNAFFGM